MRTDFAALNCSLREELYRCVPDSWILTVNILAVLDSAYSHFEFSYRGIIDDKEFFRRFPELSSSN